MENPKEDNNPYGWVRRVGTLIQIPVILAVSPIVGCVIGLVIDRAAHTRPIFTFIFLLVGFAAGVKETWTIIRRASSDK